MKLWWGPAMHIQKKLRKEKFHEAMVKNRQRHHGICRMSNVQPDFSNLEAGLKATWEMVNTPITR